MDIASTANAFAQVLGLICNFRQERGSRQDDDFQTFITWLTHHKFEKVRELVCSSQQMQRDFEVLFTDTSGVLNQKLDLLAASVTGLAERMDGLKQVASHFGGGEQLSDQAIAILDWFDASRRPNLIFLSSVPELTQCALLPGGTQFDKSEDVRFMADDIGRLESLNFIKLTDHNGSGDPIFALTREGAQFARITRERTTVTHSSKGV